MPPPATVTNRHLKALAAPWLSVGYCEVLNGMPSLAAGSMLGANTHGPSNNTNGNNSSGGGCNGDTSGSSGLPPAAFLYGGIFDAQSVSIERPPLPPHMQRIVSGATAGGRFNGDYDETEHEEREEAARGRRGGKKGESGPPPPPAWRCAADTAARMDAYLSSHRTDVAGQQRWLRELTTLARQQKEDAQQQNGQGQIGGQSNSPSSSSSLSSSSRSAVLSSPHYKDVVTVQLEARRQRAHLRGEQQRSRLHSGPQRIAAQQQAAAMAAAERARLAEMARRIDSGGRGWADASGQTASTAPPLPSSASSSPPQPPAQQWSSPLPTPTEASQYQLLADREFLMSVRNAFLHADGLLKESNAALAALAASTSKPSPSSAEEAGSETNDAGGVNEGCDVGATAEDEAKRARLAEAAGWAKQQLRALTSDGSCALWFAAAPLPPKQNNQQQQQQEKRVGGTNEEEGGAVSLSVFSTGNSRAVRVGPELIAAYLVANGVDLDAYVAALRRMEMIQQQQLQDTDPSAASCRLSRTPTPTPTHPWQWSVHERRRAAEAAARKASKGVAYESALPAHHAANPHRALAEARRLHAAAAAASGGDVSAMIEEREGDEDAADWAGQDPLSLAASARLPDSIFSALNVAAVPTAQTTGGAGGRSVCDSPLPRQTARTLTGHGSLMGFSQAFRLRSIRGLVIDHSPANAAERRRCCVAAENRSLSSLVGTASAVNESAVVADEFDVGSYLAKAAAAPFSNSSTSSSSSSSSPFGRVDVPLLTLHPPSLVTRCLGLIRYKLNPRLAPHEQILIPAPDNPLATSSASTIGGGGAAAELRLAPGEVVIMCGRSVFESEMSDAHTFAADGATVDDIVEAVLQGILAQVSRGIEAGLAEAEERNALSASSSSSAAEGSPQQSTSSVPSSLSSSSSIASRVARSASVDAKALASNVCSAGLECGTRKSLQALVLVVPPTASPSPLAFEGVEKDMGVGAGETTSSFSSSVVESDPAFVVSDTVVADAVRLTSSLVPAPINPTLLRADPLYRAAFCDDLARSGVGLTSYLEMRFKLLSRVLLEGGSGGRGGGGGKGSSNAACSITNHGASRLRSANGLIDSCYATIGAQMRRMVRSEAFVFGDGPPRMSCHGQAGEHAAKITAYYRSLSRELFGRGRAAREE